MNKRLSSGLVAAALLASVAMAGASRDASSSAPATRARAASVPASVIHELRIYEIFEGNKKAFHERFRDHAVRLMGKYGFRIVSIWETKFNGKTEFVYLLEWPDRSAMTAAWAKLRADQEWIDIKAATTKAHGDLIGEIEDRVLELTDYSPGRTLIPGK